MLRKLICLLLIICLVSTVPVISAAEQPIEFYVNNEKINGINPIMKSGVMYVPYRDFFNALGYKVSYDANTEQISGVINGSELFFWVGEDLVEYNDHLYSADEPIPIINGRVYLPIRLIGNLANYSVSYDKQIVNLYTYGFGQETAVRDLVTKYYETHSPTLLTYDNRELSYYNLNVDYDAYLRVSEVPVRDFVVTINKIEYTSANEANLEVTYIKNTEILDQKDVFAYKVRKDSGQWRILAEKDISSNMQLPSDINETVAKIMEKQNKEQNAILSDLHTYYKADNEENLNLALQYTSPLFIKRWNAVIIDPNATWERVLAENYFYSEEKRKLSEERVVFIGEKEAVVHAMLEWSDASDEYAEDQPYLYEVLIYMDYANGHWNYYNSLHINIF